MRRTLDQLRTLVAVAEHGTMGGAALTRGYITRAGSQQMAALAQAVGRPLFVRDGARLARSDDGITLVTPLMLAMRTTNAPTVPLPGPATRDVVALARTSASERAGVRAVRAVLVETFTS